MLPTIMIAQSFTFYTHKIDEKGKIVPDKFLQYIPITNSYIEHTCSAGTHWNCKKAICDWPGACECK